MNINYCELKTEIKVSIKNIIINALKKYKAGKVCGFAICSDRNAMSVSVSFNTKQNLYKKIEENPEKENDFRFIEEHWDYYETSSRFKKSIGAYELSEISAKLYTMRFKIGDKKLDEHKKNMFQIFLEILEEIKNEQVFGGEKDIILLFCIIDDFIFPENTIECVKKINSTIIGEQYEKWANEPHEIEWDNCDEDE
ncbi:MAG: DUF4303 domain-containing protein [Bacteroidetes bacterium]|nr:DUF4303 domain-containing protein [Bacteroidota bacterium]